MSNWSDYKQKLFKERYDNTCANCTLRDQPGPVWGCGDPTTSRIIYIAQNPGVDEVNARPMQPLIGASGRVFNRQLSESGLRRDELYITNQCKCLTPSNREPSLQELLACRPHLQVELDRCKADTVVLAGDISFRAHLETYSTIHPKYRPANKKKQPVGIMSRMGCVEQKDNRKWLGTIHPAFVMRMPQWRDAAIEHLRKADAIAGVAIPLPQINEHPTNTEVHKLVDHICLESREFADDVETHQEGDIEEDDYIGGDYKVDMLGIGGEPYKALVLDPDQIHLVAPIFADKEIWRYEHNGPYDEYHIAKFVQTRSAKPFDTMLATHYLRSFAPKKLKPFVLSTYTNLPYYNRDLELVNRRLYNGLDIVTTFLAAKEQRAQLQKWQLEEIFFKFGMPLLPILEEMRVKGANVDLRKALLFKQLTEDKIRKAEALIQKICGVMFNPRSDKQVMAFLYDQHKLPIQTKRTPDNRTIPTVDFEARKRLRWWIEVNPERLEKYKIAYYLLQLLDYQSGEEKKLEYIGRISGDGRIHAFFKAHGTNSFRLSTSPNFQNFPIYPIEDWGGARRDDSGDKEAPVTTSSTGVSSLGSIRSIVISDNPATDVLLTVDFSMLQLAIYAARFGAKWLLDIYEKGEYVYGVIYEELYKEPFFEVGKPKTKKYKLPNVPEQRIRRAKAVPLGFVKGRSIDAVAEEYGSVSEATRIRNWWFSKVPEFAQAVETVKYEVTQKGYLRHPHGQITHFPSKKLTKALDSCGQSPEAFIMIGTLVDIDAEFKRRRYEHTRLVLSVHDSLTVNVPEHHCVEVYEEICKPILERAIPELNNLKLNHSAEVSLMWDWSVLSYNSWKENFLNGKYLTRRSS